MEVEGYKFTDPYDVEPTVEDIAAARSFLIANGYGPDTPDFEIGIDLVARMLATGDETLKTSPIGWRFSADLDAPDERVIVMLSQRHETSVVKDLMVVGTFEDSEAVREAFMQTAD